MRGKGNERTRIRATGGTSNSFFFVSVFQSVDFNSRQFQAHLNENLEIGPFGRMLFLVRYSAVVT